MPDLLTLEDVKHQLRLTDTEINNRANELQTILDQATDIVLALINGTEHWRTISATWTAANVPTIVKVLILKQVAYMNQYRGDEEKDRNDDGLAPGLAHLSWLTRDPVIG